MAGTAQTFRTTDLSVGYRKESPLFDKLDLELKPGQLVCLMGPNGAGKSTLLRTMAGLQPALSGSLSHRSEQQLAVVLTDKISSTHMTALELVTFGRYPYLDWRVTLSESDHALVGRVVNSVRIESLVHKRLYELSDGQLQMVLIARALVQDTPVLLLDEPTAHLDLNNRLEIMNLLRGLAHENRKAVLVATHELDLALQTADLIWLASVGRIRQGIPEDLVLDGSFDDVFQLKGFDLKTGKVQHKPHRAQTISIVGEGPVVLWTRNALERSGFRIDEKGTITIKVEPGRWNSGTATFNTLASLLDWLSASQDTSRS